MGSREFLGVSVVRGVVAGTSTSVAMALVNPQPKLRWFGPAGAVERHEDGWCSVYVGGSLWGEYNDRDPGMRDTLIVLVSRDGRVRPGQVAAAFGVCTEVVRKAKARAQEGGDRGAE